MLHYPHASFFSPGDILINARESSTGHIVEIQVTLRELLEIKEGTSHQAYELARMMDLNAEETTTYRGSLNDSVIDRIKFGMIRKIYLRKKSGVEKYFDSLVDALGAPTCLVNSLTISSDWHKDKTISDLFTKNVITQLKPFLKRISIQPNKDEYPNVGDLPEAIWHCPNLIGITCCHSHVGGTIPPAVGNLKALRSINVWESNFRGTVPEELGQCNSLREFYINGCSFEGNFPVQAVGALKYLKRITLSGNNKFSNTLPLEDMEIYFESVTFMKKTIYNKPKASFISLFESDEESALGLNFDEVIQFRYMSTCSTCERKTKHVKYDTMAHFVYIICLACGKRESKLLGAAESEAKASPMEFMSQNDKISRYIYNNSCKICNKDKVLHTKLKYHGIRKTSIKCSICATRTFFKEEKTNVSYLVGDKINAFPLGERSHLHREGRIVAAKDDLYSIYFEGTEQRQASMVKNIPSVNIFKKISSEKLNSKAGDDICGYKTEEFQICSSCEKCAQTTLHKVTELVSLGKKCTMCLQCLNASFTGKKLSGMAQGDEVCILTTSWDRKIAYTEGTISKMHDDGMCSVSLGAGSYSREMPASPCRLFNKKKD